MPDNNPQTAYEAWLADPTPERMAATVRSLNPMLTSEIQRYSGPKPVLHSRAKALAVGAIRSYNPSSGAKLTSWITTQLQPLNRYGRSVSGSVQVPEVALRQAAELESRRLQLVDELGDEPTNEQLADAIGLSVTRVTSLRRMVRPVMSEGALEDIAEEGSDDSGGGAPGVMLQSDPSLRFATETVHGELGERDRRILELKTGYGGTAMLDNKTIAKRLGVSPALISQRSLEIANQIKKVHSHGQ
jgi:RNA polymerase primary sigma factor